jgi:hypothetical protein
MLIDAEAQQFRKCFPFCIRKRRISRYNRVSIWRLPNQFPVCSFKSTKSSNKVPQIKPILSPTKQKRRATAWSLFGALKP